MDMFKRKLHKAILAWIILKTESINVIPTEFWQELKTKGVIEQQYPYL